RGELRRLQVDGRAGRRQGHRPRTLLGATQIRRAALQAAGASESRRRNAQGRGARPERVAAVAGAQTIAGDPEVAARERTERRLDQATDCAGAGLFRDDPADVRHDDVEMKWKFFIGSCILVAGLLLKAGAPVVAVILGIAVAAFLTWQKQRT